VKIRAKSPRRRENGLPKGAKPEEKEQEHGPARLGHKGKMTIILTNQLKSWGGEITPQEVKEKK